VGKRRFEAALAAFEHRDDVEVLWRSFELDPSAPRRRELSAAEHLGQKYGMSADQVAEAWARLTALGEAEGLEYHLERTQGGSSFDAHRLLKLGAELGRQNAVKERLLRGHFTEGLALGEPEVLARLGVEAGLPAARVSEVIAGDEFADSVREDERQARLLGISGVPFFVFGERYGVSGAQSTTVLLEALRSASTTAP